MNLETAVHDARPAGHYRESVIELDSDGSAHPLREESRSSGHDPIPHTVNAIGYPPAGSHTGQWVSGCVSRQDLMDYHARTGLLAP